MDGDRRNAAVHRRLKSQPPASAIPSTTIHWAGEDEVDALKLVPVLPLHLELASAFGVGRGEEGAATASYACEEQESRAVGGRDVGGRKLREVRTSRTRMKRMSRRVLRSTVSYGKMVLFPGRRRARIGGVARRRLNY